jgi:signal transduction histidine kinase/ActR/RegA family two-component response regulator
MNTNDNIRKLAAFPRTSPYPVLEFSAGGDLLYSNDAAQRMAASLGEQSMQPILPPDTKAVIHQCLLTGENKLNLHTTVKDRTIAWSFIPIGESGTVHCYANEITERLALEAQLRYSVKMEAVGQLAAGVAHEINNVLTIIQGHSDLMLQAQPLPEPAENSLRQIRSAADRAGKLIQQLLMFSRKQVMQPRQTDLNEVISSVIPMLQRMIGDRVTLEFAPVPNLPAICADPGMIEQVLVNLSINARDAMPGGGRLAISAAPRVLEPVACVVNPEARPGHFVCLSVTDTGAGMDHATLSHLFEPFFTTKEVGRGTGLGLATVYGIVKQHQGWIIVDSKPGRGSTFTLFLPCLARTAEIPAPPASPAAPPPAAGSETLLVVEDEASLRELVVRILEICGYHIYQARNGVEALEVWARHKEEIDLLLTDMVMPEGITGRQLAERLQREDPGLKVIYTSGYSPGLAGKDIALLEGFNFLAKPYPPSRLAQVVRDCLDGKNDRGQKRKS